MDAELPGTDPRLELLRLTRMFATLINAGVSLVRCLAVLEAEMPVPFAKAIHDINAQVMAGRTLYAALQTHDTLFSPAYLALVRAGEVGGILDETLLYLAELLQEEWELARLTAPDDAPAPLFIPGTAQPTAWAELSRVRQSMTLSLCT